MQPLSTAGLMCEKALHGCGEVMTQGRRNSRKPDRDELAKRLRENLRRRKAQLRARGGTGGKSAPDGAKDASAGDEDRD